MSARLLSIGILAAIGIVAPFAIVRRLLDLAYVPDVAGTPPPGVAMISAYVFAVAIASAVFYFAARAIRNDRTPPAAGEPLSGEELPE